MVDPEGDGERFLDPEEAMGLLALVVAGGAAAAKEVPVGAVLRACDGRILAIEGNRVVDGNNPLGHAELRALARGARRIENFRLTGADLCVTLRPCSMCQGAMENARLGRWWFLADREAATAHAGEETVDGREDLAWRRDSDVCRRDVQEAVALLRFFFEPRR